MTKHYPKGLDKMRAAIVPEHKDIEITTEKPMSEYEPALTAIVRVLLKTVIDLGASRELIRDQLRLVSSDFREMGSKNDAAAIENLTKHMTESDNFYRPNPVYRCG